MKLVIRCITALLLIFTVNFYVLASEATHSASPSPSPSTINNAVNINTADAQTISAAGLKGIGQKRAEAIVAYRQQHGAFKTVDDLKNIKGVSQKVIDANRSKITVN